LLVALVLALWPARTLRRASELDSRLAFGDRLATAWTFRDSDREIVRLQRADAVARLGGRSPKHDLVWGPSRVELGAFIATSVVALVLLITPSPQQAVLDQQAADALAIQRAADRLDALRQEAAAVSSLTPEQARQLDELLQLAHADLSRARTQREATAILARTGQQLNQQLADPNADLRDEALAAMSETLSAEPLTRSLGEALQHEDGQAASNAMKSIAAEAEADRLSDVQRQGLSRALQRAANVGRAEPASASALREAARAVAAGEPAGPAMSAAEAALREAIQSATAQTSLRATTERLRALEAQLAANTLGNVDLSALSGMGESRARPNSDLTELAGPIGTPVALDATGRRLRDSSADRDRGGGGAGVGAGTQPGQRLTGPAAQPSENVFVPGREGLGPSEQDLSSQPFNVRAAPRPYREVVAEYAQSSREYVDRPDVSPAVRDLVKQYFQQLQEGEGQ
jgi:hypothetical protein